MENQEFGAAKRGRPALTPEHHRVQVSTTLPLPMKVNIDRNNWKINELITDGVAHRTECRGLFEKIGRLQTTIEEKNRQLFEFEQAAHIPQEITEENDSYRGDA